eukprot:836442-Pleurochrysis_carterae.AAC.1
MRSRPARGRLLCRRAGCMARRKVAVPYASCARASEFAQQSRWCLRRAQQAWGLAEVTQAAGRRQSRREEMRLAQRDDCAVGAMGSRLRRSIRRRW